jgi:flagellar biosynthesis protein FliQ
MRSVALAFIPRVLLAIRVLTFAEYLIPWVVAKLVPFIFNVRHRHNAIFVEAKALLVFVI